MHTNSGIDWLDLLLFSETTISFIDAHKDDIIDKCKDWRLPPMVAVSVALFEVAVNHAPFSVLQELLVKFVKGELYGTHEHYGPMYLEHAAAIALDLESLIREGVLTSNGQERSTDKYADQRGYLTGQFIIAFDTDVNDLLAMLSAIGCCFAATVNGFANGCFLHTFGDDEVRDTLLTATEYQEISSTIYVSRSPGIMDTNVFLDSKDVFNLHRFMTGDVVSFDLWDPTWPEEGEEPRASIESRFLAILAASASAHVPWTTDVIGGAPYRRL